MTRSEINPKTVVQKEYHDLVVVFPEKNLDKLFFHQKYDYKIILEEEQKYGHAL